MHYFLYTLYFISENTLAVYTIQYSMEELSDEDDIIRREI